MRLLRVLCALAVFSLPLAGCDEDSGPDPGSSLADAQCVAYDSCCRAAGKPNSVNACKSFISLAAGGGLGPDAAACEALTRERTADGTFCTLGTRKGGVDVCKNAYASNKSAPTKALGAACEDDDECIVAAGATAECASRTSSGATSRTCTEILPGTAGAGPCSRTRKGSFSSYVGSFDAEGPSSTYECDRADGLYCDPEGRTCLAVVALGEPCESQNDCPDDSTCRKETSSSSSVCVAHLAVGDACSTGDACVTGTACTGGTCTALAAAGTACAKSAECAGGSCTNGTCSGGASGLFTICFTDN